MKTLNKSFLFYIQSSHNILGLSCLLTEHLYL